MANSINLDTAERLDITCRRGDSFALDLDVTSSSGEVLNMTDYTFKMEVRTTDTVNGAFDSAVPNSGIILTTLDTSNSDNKKIVPTTNNDDLAAGDVSFTVSADNMSRIPGGAYVYDIQATDAGDPSKTTTWLYGAFIVNEDVSV